MTWEEKAEALGFKPWHAKIIHVLDDGTAEDNYADPVVVSIARLSAVTS